MHSSYTDYRVCLRFLSLALFVVFFVPSPVSAHKDTHIPLTRVKIALSDPDIISNMQTGATHTEKDVDSLYSDRVALFARQLLQSALTFQNQHIMGWGTEDPEPMPGVFNWSSLDERVNLMRSTHAQMVLTLCCAPSWMRPVGYQNEWGDLETAPDPKHVQDFAKLVQAVALRYPDVRYFQVWNELKGMWSTSSGMSPSVETLNRWDYERYTTLYNAVYDAIKKVRPAAKIGGPYISLLSDGNKAHMVDPGPSYPWGTFDQRSLDVISYWLAHKHGADFITVDGSSANDDGIYRTDPFSSAQKFADISNWIRRQPGGGATLPLWWAEWYAGDTPPGGKSLDYYNALMASDEIATLKSKASVVLIWGPQGDTRGYAFPEGIWMDSRYSGNSQATPYYNTLYAFKNYFGPGTQLYKTSTSTSMLTVVASASHTMFVNHLPTLQEVIVNGLAYYLKPYQVRLIQTP